VAQAHGRRRAALARLGAVALVIALAVMAAPAARAVPITMTDGTSTVSVDPDSSAGVYEWNIGSTSYLNQQWFWFRNNLDDYDDREYSIDELSLNFALQPIPNLAILEYTDIQSRFAIQVTYLLTGTTGILTSDLAEAIRITNLSDDPLSFDFFQYSDFDLGGDTDDYSVVVTGGNTVMQIDYGTAISLLETVVTGSPDLSETGVFSTTLTDLDIDDLDGTVLKNGPANLTWAFEWADRVINPGQAFIISKDKLLTIEPVAEPGSFALLVLGLGGIVRLKRRK